MALGYILHNLWYVDNVNRSLLSEQSLHWNPNRLLHLGTAARHVPLPDHGRPDGYDGIYFRIPTVSELLFFTFCAINDWSFCISFPMQDVSNNGLYGDLAIGLGENTVERCK
jgi:hypothetical protein